MFADPFMVDHCAIAAFQVADNRPATLPFNKSMLAGYAVTVESQGVVFGTA
jgi:hypothetical protein